MSKAITRSIRFKLAGLLAFSAIIGIVLSSLAMFFYMNKTLKREGMNNLHSITTVLADNMVASLEFEDTRDINETLQSLNKQQDVQAAFVYNRHQHLLQRYSREGNNDPQYDTLIRQQNQQHGLTTPFSYMDRTHMLVSEPVFSDGEYVGTVSVIANADRVRQHSRELIVAQIIVAALAVLLVLLLAMRMQRMFTDPVLKLRDAMYDFSRDPDAHRHVYHHTDDEFGALFDGYNHMLDAIEAHRQELKFQRQALDEHAIVTTVDNEGIIVQVNERFCQLTGYDKQKVIGQSYRDIFFTKDNEQLSRQVWQTINNGDTWRGEICAHRKDGSTYWVYASIVPFLDEHGQPLKFIGVRTDITERKQAEEAMRQARELAEEATRAKSEFLSMMSHEIRTPMNAIIGMTHLALQTTLTDKQRDYLNKTQTAARSLLALINDILDFSKIEAGKLEMEEIPFELSTVLNDLASVVGLRVQEKHLELFFSVEQEASVPLLGDPLRLGQVLLNLTNNAIKFTEQGEISIHVKALTDDEGDDDNAHMVLQFSVRDTGIGMNKAQQQRLFQAFSQTDSSITRKYGGTGLGLIISKRLVNMMGGDITVSSEPDKGSCFTFTVRLKKDRHQKQQQLKQLDNLTGLHVLVVDDSETSRVIMRQYLQRFDFDVVTAASGAEALTCITSAERPFDLVFMDWHMPGDDGQSINGMETIRRIRQQLGDEEMPTIVMVSAWERDAVLQEAHDILPDGFITKPVTQSSIVDALLNTFAEHLSASSAAKPAPAAFATNALQGLRLLVVEDNAINQQIAKELLTREGCLVTLADNGREALDILARETFDIVLMDIQMPEMDGYTATREIRKHKAWNALPVIAMTAHAMAEERQRCLDCGMNDHVSKPIDIRELVQTLSRYLPQSNNDDHVQPPANKHDVAPALLSDEEISAWIDIPAALKLLGNNQVLLANLLETFIRRYQQADTTMAQYLEQEDWRHADELSHEIKGTAGNLSATALYEAATRLNDAVRQQLHGQHNDELAVLADTFGKALRQTIEAMRRYPG